MCISILEKVDGVTLKEMKEPQFLDVSSTLDIFMDNNNINL